MPSCAEEADGKTRLPHLVSTPATIVAIPVRDEAERVEACLTALAAQTDPPTAVLVLLNNCRDDTGAIAQSVSLPFPLLIETRDWPAARASAGRARRIAMRLAAERAGKGGMLLTTDADTVVPPDWIARNRRALRAGADVVCGRIVVDPVEAELIPLHLHADDARETTLITLLDEIAWLLDPDPADPWPRHTEASGATLAVSTEAFFAVGGIPDQPSGEDRAFVAALRRRDARIRHDPGIAVTVSGRIEGHTPGGMADTIRRRMVQQDLWTDDQVEPAEDALRRADLRRRCRWRWEGTPVPDLAAALELPDSVLATCLDHPFFGAAWHALEQCSPVLQRRRVRFVDLPQEIAQARVILTRLRAAVREVES
jgi:hypothetical protein